MEDLAKRIESITGHHIHWHVLWNNHGPLIYKCRCGAEKRQGW